MQPKFDMEFFNVLVNAEKSKASDLAQLKQKLHQMQKQLTFVRFEIQERQHSPNAIIGVTTDDKRVFITAPASALGKQVGDEIANTLKGALELAFLTPTPEKVKAWIHQYLHKIAILHDPIVLDELELLSCPGDHIKESMQALGIDFPLFVIRMGIASDAAQNLLNGNAPLTEAIARRLELTLNIDAQFWLNLETNYRNKLASLTNNHNHEQKP